MKHRAKAVTAACGVAVIAVLGLALVSWRSFQTQYYVWKLRHEKTFFEKALESPDGTAERRALLEYVKAQDGSSRVMEHFLYVFMSLANQPTLLEALNEGRMSLTTAPGKREDEVWMFWQTIHTLSGLPDLLPMIQGKIIVLPEHPRLRLQILPLDDAVEAYKKLKAETVDGAPGPSLIRPLSASEYPYACLIEFKRPDH